MRLTGGVWRPLVDAETDGLGAGEGDHGDVGMVAREMGPISSPMPGRKLTTPGGPASSKALARWWWRWWVCVVVVVAVPARMDGEFGGDGEQADDDVHLQEWRWLKASIEWVVGVWWPCGLWRLWCDFNGQGEAPDCGRVFFVVGGGRLVV